MSPVQPHPIGSPLTRPGPLPDRAAPWRLVFMGTPDFARPSLARLAAEHAVVGVFTQPDRPAGRGRRLQPSPVKALALELGIPVLQPGSFRHEPTALEALHALAPDLLVVAAYGLILPPAVLDSAPAGALNVHASLLPRWRGAAPVAQAILAGDAQTGVTIMRMDAGLDTGPMLTRRSIPIPPRATTGELTARLADLGADLLAETLPRWMAGEIEPEAQDAALATYAPRLRKIDGRLDWREPAEALARRVRAMAPWPGAYTEWAGQTLKLHAVELPSSAELAGLPGDGPAIPTPSKVVDSAAGPLVATGRGWLRLETIQVAGGKAMRAIDFARGRADFIAACLGGDDLAAGLGTPE